MGATAAVIVTYFQKRYLAICSFDERFIPKAAGFQWDPVVKRWWTESTVNAGRLRNYADGSAREMIDRAFRPFGEAVAKVAATPLLDLSKIPVPAGLVPFPYQREGVGFILRHRDTLLADEMGLGKTIQAILAANCMPKLHRVLVICPASLRKNWQIEWKRWSTMKGVLTVALVNGFWVRALESEDGPPMVAITSYQGVKKWRQRIEAVKWGMLIADEAHALKDPKAQQTRAVVGSAGGRGKEGKPAIQAARRVYITGTPITNKPEDLWPILREVDPTGMGANFSVYRQNYCYTDMHRAEFHQRLQKFTVRRLKKDVLSQLPAKRRQMVLVEVEGEADVLATERAFLSRKSHELAALKHENAVQKLNMWRGAALTEIAKIRHDTAVKKVPAVIEHVYKLLDEEPKIVLFAHHHDVIDGISKAFSGACVVFDGRQSMEARAESMALFQNKVGCRLFIGSIRAAGLGITLTAASTVVFAELDWTPAAMIQAEDRLHRIGQKSAVLAQHLVIDGSIDARMSEILIEKSVMIDAMIDGKAPEHLTGSILEELLKA